MALNAKTLFVVGAGASKEAGLPTGNELKAKIAEKLCFKFDEFGSKQLAGDSEILGTLKKHVAALITFPNEINSYVHAGQRIANAMPQAISIDNFIDSHQGDEKIELCGKLAIVKSILEAEKNSNLFCDQHRQSQINFTRIEETWYNKFMKLLTEECRKEDIKGRLQNVSFITFNYDRCIEHFLFHALQNYYGIDAPEATEYLASLKVFHPYGLVGHLPWGIGPGGTPFGGHEYRDDLLSLTKQIKTFTERVEEETMLEEIRKTVREAEFVVFLGFAFHKQNMRLLQPMENRNSKQVFATAKGISDSDCKIIEKSIKDMILKNKKNHRSYVRNDLVCSTLFDNYWRALAIY